MTVRITTQQNTRALIDQLTTTRFNISTTQVVRGQAHGLPFDENDPAFDKLKVWTPDASGSGSLATLLRLKPSAIRSAERRGELQEQRILLRDIIDLWSRGNPAAPPVPRDESAPAEEPPALFRDAKGRVFVRAKPSSRSEERV